MRYKAVFLDIDDTLIGKDKMISAGNSDAIRRAQEAGAYVTIATGRGYLGSSAIWKGIGVRGPVIVYGGAIVMDTKTDEVLFSGDIDPELISDVLEAAQVWGLHAQIYQGDTVIYERESEFGTEYSKVLNLPKVIDNDIRKKQWRGVPKVLAYAPPEIEHEMVARFKERFVNRLEVASSKPGFIELNRYGVNKGTTMALVASMLGIGIEETIAVGDNTLDLEMIRMAGLGVCVGDGQQAVKDIADVLAPACDEDGVKWVIEQYVLGKGAGL